MFNKKEKKKETKKQAKYSKQAQNKKNKKKKTKLPKTVQQTIPYIYAYQNGIFEIEEGVFSKSYALEDINFKIASQEDQNQIFIAFGDFLNSSTIMLLYRLRSLTEILIWKSLKKRFL